MNVQYVSDKKGQIVAVQLPIKEWERIKDKYPNVDHIDEKLPKWHKDVIDDRLNAIQNEPSRIRPVSELMKEPDL